MALPFISLSDQAIIGEPFNNLHATFARPITIFRDENQVIINTPSPNDNFLFPGAPNNSFISGVQVSGIFLARIKYPEKQALNFFSTSVGTSQDQINIRKEDGLVRIKLDPTGATYLQGAQRVILDGDLFTIDTSKQPHGLVSIIQFYTFYLKRDN
jgi:hypothetical protein